MITWTTHHSIFHDILKVFCISSSNRMLKRDSLWQEAPSLLMRHRRISSPVQVCVLEGWAVMTHRMCTFHVMTPKAGTDPENLELPKINGASTFVCHLCVIIQ